MVHIHHVDGRCGAAPPLAPPRLKGEQAGYVADLGRVEVSDTETACKRMQRVLSFVSGVPCRQRPPPPGPHGWQLHSHQGRYAPRCPADARDRRVSEPLAPHPQYTELSVRNASGALYPCFGGVRSDSVRSATYMSTHLGEHQAVSFSAAACHEADLGSSGCVTDGYGSCDQADDAQLRRLCPLTRSTGHGSHNRASGRAAGPSPALLLQLLLLLEER